MGSETPIETSIAPWLSVSDAAKAVEYYKKGLGAVEVYRLDDKDGQVVVAQLKIGGAEFWLQDDIDSSPTSLGEGSVRMSLTVDDPDAVFKQAVAAGATEVAAVHEEHGWRTGRVSDPFGHDWEVSKPSTPLALAAPAARGAR